MSETITNVSKAGTTQLSCSNKVTLSVLLGGTNQFLKLQEQANEMKEAMKETFNANYILIIQYELLKRIKKLINSKFTVSCADNTLISNLRVISEFIWQQTNEKGNMSFEYAYSFFQIDNPVLENFFSPTEVIPQKIEELNLFLKDINIKYIYIDEGQGKNKKILYNYILPSELKNVIIELKKIKGELL